MYDDIKAVVGAAARYDAIVKVIIETCLLTDEEKLPPAVFPRKQVPPS